VTAGFSPSLKRSVDGFADAPIWNFGDIFTDSLTADTVGWRRPIKPVGECLLMRHVSRMSFGRLHEVCLAIQLLKFVSPPVCIDFVMNALRDGSRPPSAHTNDVWLGVL
jgi:hypothetical protein